MPIDYSQSPTQSLDEAAQTALSRAWKCSANKRECGGVIYEAAHIDGQVWYFASTVETSDKPFGLEIKAAAAEPPPAGMTVVASYHVHICNIHNRAFAPFFSKGDTLSDRGLHLIGYMMDGCSGDVHRWDYRQDDEDDEEVDFKSGKVLYLTIGHITGHVDLRSIK